MKRNELSVGRKSALDAAGVGDVERMHEASFLTCPGGHKLPRKGAAGECTPVHCAEGKSDVRSTVRSDAVRMRRREKEREKKAALRDVAAVEALPAAGEEKGADRRPAPSARPAAERVAAGDALATAEPEGLTAEARRGETARLARSRGRAEARADILGVPKGLSGAAAEDWADKRLVELLPYAVAEKEFQLLHGDDDQRSKAADAVLAATGRGRKEAGAAPQPTILIVGAQGADGRLAVPWAQRQPVQVQAAVVVQDALPPGFGGQK